MCIIQSAACFGLDGAIIMETKYKKHTHTHVYASICILDKATSNTDFTVVQLQFQCICAYKVFTKLTPWGRALPENQQVLS